MNELLIFPKGREPVTLSRWPASFQPQGKGYYWHRGHWYRFNSKSGRGAAVRPEQVPRVMRTWALILA